MVIFYHSKAECAITFKHAKALKPLTHLNNPPNILLCRFHKMTSLMHTKWVNFGSSRINHFTGATFKRIDERGSFHKRCFAERERERERDSLSFKLFHISSTHTCEEQISGLEDAEKQPRSYLLTLHEFLLSTIKIIVDI